MRQAALITILALLCLVQSGCSDSKDEPRRTSRPWIEATYVEVPLGGEATVEVHEAGEVEVASAPDCVEARAEGSLLMFFGKAVGKGDVTVRADGQTMQIVAEVKDLGPLPQRYPADADEQTADKAVRCSVGTVTMAYDTPGNMFVQSRDGKQLTAVSLVTGMQVRFAFSRSVWEYEAVQLPLEIADAAVEVGGEKIETEYVALMRREEGTVWLLAMQSGGREVWMVAGR